MPRSAQDSERFVEREARIIRTTREIAEREGWPAVTVRRLAEEIGVSQPILYRHFPGGRDDIVGRVVMAGYAELATAMEVGGDGPGALPALIAAYLDFARAHPSTYEAMASARSGIAFASDDTPEVLRRGFELLTRAVGGVDARDRAVRAELLWSTLHGISQLAAHGRLDADLDGEREEAVASLFRRGASA
ncbi:TetR/AcrR family transcriptional regulator [Leifsonia sp. NPDC080035]|uniref:TetR/AcrR family transcriptional regulator n=1 Tax=Leifsonia sp. NPDC080035 TaxID=3143936 RepID=A0AAU7GH25_9MICO